MTNIAREIWFETSSPLYDAIGFLDHVYKEVSDLFGFYKEEANEKASVKRQVAMEVCRKLKALIQAEDEIFLPEIKRFIKDTRTISSITMEHCILRYLVEEIEHLDVDSDVYDIKMSVLAEHVKNLLREKQSKLFPKVKAIGKIDLWRLGGKLATHKMISLL